MAPIYELYRHRAGQPESWGLPGRRSCAGGDRRVQAELRRRRDTIHQHRRRRGRWSRSGEVGESERRPGRRQHHIEPGQTLTLTAVPVGFGRHGPDRSPGIVEHDQQQGRLDPGERRDCGADGGRRRHGERSWLPARVSPARRSRLVVIAPCCQVGDGAPASVAAVVSGRADAQPDLRRRSPCHRRRSGWGAGMSRWCSRPPRRRRRVPAGESGPVGHGICGGRSVAGAVSGAWRAWRRPGLSRERRRRRGNAVICRRSVGGKPGPHRERRHSDQMGRVGIRKRRGGPAGLRRVSPSPRSAPIRVGPSRSAKA